VDPLWAVAPLSAFLGLCLVAPPFPRWSFFLPILTAGPGNLGAVALTFDDGPDPVSTLPLLEVLSRHRVKAAFFVVGSRAEAHPELIREILARGHEIGNHSRRHDVFLMLRSYRTLESEISECQEILCRQGVRTLAFRPPVGITNSRLRGVLERLGMFCVCFRCRPLDFGNRRVVGLSQRVLRTVEGGDIVLLHDCRPRRGVEPWLAEIEAMLQGLESRGIGVLPLSTMLGRPVMELDSGQGGRS
jgi:peptidoglycan/xylan/chitin deacetylase (PgdA/CDA1 family)